MSSLVLRKCNSEKICSDCENTIKIGVSYYTGPNKSLCVACYAIEKTNAGETKQLLNDSYIVTGNCSWCEHPAIGVLWNKKVCGEHIQNAIMESV